MNDLYLFFRCYSVIHVCWWLKSPHYIPIHVLGKGSSHVKSFTNRPPEANKNLSSNIPREQKGVCGSSRSSRSSHRGYRFGSFWTHELFVLLYELSILRDWSLMLLFSPPARWGPLDSRFYQRCKLLFSSLPSFVRCPSPCASLWAPCVASPAQIKQTCSRSSWRAPVQSSKLIEHTRTRHAQTRTHARKNAGEDVRIYNVRKNVRKNVSINIWYNIYICQIECQQECQIKCQNVCQIQWQEECQMTGRMPNRLSEFMSDRLSARTPGERSEYMSGTMPGWMPNRMSEYMSHRIPDRMSEYMSDRMSARMPDEMSEYMSDRMPEIMSEICQIDCQQETRWNVRIYVR